MSKEILEDIPADTIRKILEGFLEENSWGITKKNL